MTTETRSTTFGASTGYRVPFVNYRQVYRDIGPELEAAFHDVLSRGQFILRDEVNRFEAEFAKFLGVKRVIGVANGTDALYMVVRAAGIGPGDEVIAPDHTFVASVGAIVFAGATPRLVEVGDDFNIDTDLVESAITSRARAIMPVHLNGRLARMDRVMEIAKRHGLLVIEDAAQAIGATYNGVKGGAWGLAGTFSFYPAKILGTPGDAGAIATNDEDLAERLLAMRDNGRTPSGEQSGYGFNSRLDNIHAAMLLVKLRYLPRWLEKRREHAAAYDAGLCGIRDLILPPRPLATGPFHDVYQNYVVRTTRKTEAMEFLRSRSIEILVNCGTPLHRYASLKLDGSFPTTERIVGESFSLPLYPELEPEQRDHVIASIREFFA
ncbi:MAG: DegT/DnrJ/EryC1/StrS family aminotransferase [Actinomycetota bacterium]|nr:DegT/DnrJ/EryC1/StrS family aminotransferase [Actinomycetota bacterium]